MYKVLIADDEPASRLLVSEALAEDNYEILTAGDGDEAWQLIAQHHPDVVILDVGMPGKTGMDVARAVKNSEVLRSIRVIVLTGLSAMDLPSALAPTLRGSQEGLVDLYVAKPFSPAMLAKDVRSEIATKATLQAGG